MLYGNGYVNTSKVIQSTYFDLLLDMFLIEKLSNEGSGPEEWDAYFDLIEAKVWEALEEDLAEERKIQPQEAKALESVLKSELLDFMTRKKSILIEILGKEEADARG